MSLLILDSTEDRMQLVQEIFDRQFKQDKKLSSEYDDYRKRQMLKDISYNLECLETALAFIGQSGTLWHPSPPSPPSPNDPITATLLD